MWFSPRRTLPYAGKPFPFPCPAVPVGVRFCLPPSSPWLSSLFLCSRLPRASSRHHSSLRWTDLWTCKCQEWRAKGKACGRWGGGMEKRVLWRGLRGRESAIALAYCLGPGALWINLYVIWGLSAYYSFRGCWFIWGWMIYGKQGNSSFIGYNQSKYLLQKTRPEDNHSLGPSSVKICYVFGSVPF